jgi:hypothetical protein
MLGWFREASTSASRWNRVMRSGSAAKTSGRTLRATSRFNARLGERLVQGDGRDWKRRWLRQSRVRSRRPFPMLAAVLRRLAFSPGAGVQPASILARIEITERGI